MTRKEWNNRVHGTSGCMLDHCNDVIMSAMAFQIISLTIVYSTVYSGTDQRKDQSSASRAFVWGIHRWPVNSPHKGPVTRKMSPFDDVIMICLLSVMSNCYGQIYRTSIHKADGHLTARSREISKPRDSDLGFSNRSIWQTPRHPRCRDVGKILERYDHYNVQFRRSETSQDLTVRRLSE